MKPLILAVFLFQVTTVKLDGGKMFIEYDKFKDGTIYYFDWVGLTSYADHLRQNYDVDMKASASCPKRNCSPTRIRLHFQVRGLHDWNILSGQASVILMANGIRYTLTEIDIPYSRYVTRQPVSGTIGREQFNEIVTKGLKLEGQINNITFAVPEKRFQMLAQFNGTLP